MLALLVLRRPQGWAPLAAAHLLLLIAVPCLAARARRAGATEAWRLVHRFHPVALLLAFYPVAGAQRHLLVHHDFDPLVRVWDAALLPGRWWATLPPRLPGWAHEVVHAVYASYWLLLFLPALLAFRRRPALVAEAVFALTLTMLVHFAASFLFPVSGPLALRRELVPEGGPFTALVALAYRTFDRGGLAFPSTHVAAAVVSGVYAGRLFPRLRWAFVTLIAGIFAATILGCFHYTLDSVAGLLTGLLGLGLAGRWYRRRGAPPRCPAT